MKISKSSEYGPVYKTLLKISDKKTGTQVILYHGTSSVFLKDILTKGLISYDGKIYLAKAIDEAKGWATQRVENLKWRKLDGGKEIIFKVKVNPNDLSEGLKGIFVHNGNIPASSIEQI